MSVIYDHYKITRQLALSSAPSYKTIFAAMVPKLFNDIIPFLSLKYINIPYVTGFAAQFIKTCFTTVISYPFESAFVLLYRGIDMSAWTSGRMYVGLELALFNAAFQSIISYGANVVLRETLNNNAERLLGTKILQFMTFLVVYPIGTVRRLMIADNTSFSDIIARADKEGSGILYRAMGIEACVQVFIVSIAFATYLINRRERVEENENQ